MTARPSRAFGLSDAMVLIAAEAVALGFNRVEWEDLKLFIDTTDVVRFPNVVAALALPHVAAFTFAVLALGLRPPRPPLRRLARRPGVVACAVASIGLLGVGLWVASNAFRDRNALRVTEAVKDENLINITFIIMQEAVWLMAFPAYADRIGFAVAGGWIALALTGQWRPRPEWHDRLGRALGGIWIGAMALLWLRSFLL